MKSGKGEIRLPSNLGVSAESGIPDDDYRDMRADLFNSSTLRNDIEIFSV